jgi:hypothetical protein
MKSVWIARESPPSLLSESFVAEGIMDHFEALILVEVVRRIAHSTKGTLAITIPHLIFAIIPTKYPPPFRQVHQAVPLIVSNPSLQDI